MLKFTLKKQLDFMSGYRFNMEDAEVENAYLDRTMSIGQSDSADYGEGFYTLLDLLEVEGEADKEEVERLDEAYRHAEAGSTYGDYDNEEVIDLDADGPLFSDG